MSGDPKTFYFQDSAGPPRTGNLVRLVPPLSDGSCNQAEVRHLLCNEWEWVTDANDSTVDPKYPQIATDICGSVHLIYLLENIGGQGGETGCPE